MGRSPASAFGFAQAFEFKPETRLGVAAQAFALVGAIEAQDDRAGNTFAKALAMNMLEIEGDHVS